MQLVGVQGVEGLVKGDNLLLGIYGEKKVNYVIQ